MDDNKKDKIESQQPWEFGGRQDASANVDGNNGTPVAKKYEIEFHDDFDSWLEEHERASKLNAPSSRQVEPSKPVQKPVEPSRPVQKPVEPSRPVQKPTEVSTPTMSDQPIKKPDPDRFKPIESNGNGDIPISRKEVVKNFKIQIDEEEYNKPAYEEEKQPTKRKDKSIYFAGRKPSKASADYRDTQGQSDEDKPQKGKRRFGSNLSVDEMPADKLRRIVLVASIFVFAVIIASYGISCINDVLAISRDDELITVTIEKDSDYKQIINALGDSGLIKHEWFCKLIGKFRGFDDEDYLYGLHYLTPDMGVEAMLTSMLADQTSDKTIRLSFPEGWTIPQIVAKLAENNVCPAEYIYDALEEVEFEYGFVSQISDNGERCFALEGYLFPDTYDFFVSEKQNGIGENPTSIINKFLGNFETKWNDVYAKRAKELGLTMDEVLIIASIIQKEAADKSQMTKVSSVIHNRLNNAAAYPTLGCDSTKKYVTNYLAPAFGSSAAGSYLNGYDTNSVRSGLPVGPICNPGLDAIEAALNPDDTNYYYFCHNNKGKIYLAETYSEFQANWSQVLRDNEEG